MIMIISLYVFSRVFIDIVTITFTTLILTEFSNIYTSVNYFTKLLSNFLRFPLNKD